MVVSSEGYFYSYSIDLENGGECSLMKQYSCVALPPLPALTLQSSDVTMFPDYSTRQTRHRMINLAGDACVHVSAFGIVHSSISV